MPVTEFLTSMADKATSAVNAAISRGDSQDSNAQGTYSASRSNALANIQHQFRTLQMHYSETGPVQRIITTQKGSVIDYDNVARDLKAHSKELYMWGQADAVDVKDVTDRLAYLSWVQGAMAGSFATALEASRLPFKLLRDAELNLKPRRENRAALQIAVTRIENAHEKGMDKRLAELRAQLKKAEAEDAPLEKEVELLRRKAVRESEEIKWTAAREYGEKLVLLAEASSTILSAFPVLPPSLDTPYTGAQTTANARAALQRALDHYKPGTSDYLSVHLSASDLSRSESRSFGVTHAAELSKLDTEHLDNQRARSATGRLSPTPEGAESIPTPSEKARSPSVGSRSTAPTPLDPSVLNHDPALIPESATSPATAAPLGVDPVIASEATSAAPVSGPTVAETGVPVSAGADGPGPASGSLRELAQSRTAGFGESAAVQVAPANVPRFSLNDGPVQSATTASGTSMAGASVFPSAEEEKRQLEREERERFLRHPSTYHANTTGQASFSSTTYESAEDEKRRLERQERERLLGGETSATQPAQSEDLDENAPENSEELPPYQDF